MQPGSRIRFCQTLITRMALLLMAASVSACITYERPVPGDPYYAATIPTAASVPQRTEGSLYQGNYGMALYTDRKALNVGDIITVTLAERTVSSKSSGVSVDKESELDFNAGPLLGTNPSFRGNSLETNLGQNRAFSGDAGADQSNSLEGNITVTVAEVLPNGALVVRGEKWITINRGDEFIRINGIVRPDDVSPDNTVPSTRLANAQISYSGTGTLADSQSMGWMSRFFNSGYWPF